MPREKKNDMRIRVLQERLGWMVENHQVKVQQKTFNFVNDCVYRLRKGKGLSPGQRRWADSIIEEGLHRVEVPVKNKKLHARIEAVLSMAHASHNHNVLGDFAVKLARGWELSEKQLSWCEAMLVEAEAGPWIPTKEEVEAMRHLNNVRYSRNTYWYGGSPRVAEAMSKISDFLEAGIPFRKYLFDTAAKSFNNRIKEINTPRFQVGDKCFTRKDQEWRMCFVMSAPYTCMQLRSVCYDVLVDGMTEKKGTDSLKKQRR
jgi:hypothetical protein